MNKIYELRLEAEKNDDHYNVWWVQPQGKKSKTFSMILPIRSSDALDLRWYLEQYYQFPGYGDHVRAKGIEKKIEQWGNAIFHAVFGNPKATNVYRNLMDSQQKGKKCYLTIGSEDPEFLSQPWEMMCDDRGPLAFRGIAIRRQLIGSGITRDFDVKLPLRVILIVSRPKNAGFIDPRNSIAPMLDALDNLPPGSLELHYCDPPTFSRLKETISQAKNEKKPFHIVHFDGHGNYFPEKGIGVLAFEEEDETIDLVSGKEIGELLSRLDIPLVLLEACRTSALWDKPASGSVAPALLKYGVKSVISFSHSVHIKASRLLVEQFYGELAGGKSVATALEKCRTRLHANPSRFIHLGPDAESINLQDWFIPQLYQVGDDIILVKNPKALAKRKKAAPKKIFFNFPPEPLYRFHGRALEILALERAFRHNEAVLITGMGGMGKTALAREAAAWWLRTGRFDAAVFFSFEQKAGAKRVIQVIGKALEGDDFISLSPEKQKEKAIALFHEIPILFIWDNFESTLPEFQEGEEVSAFLFGEEEREEVLKLYGEMTSGNPLGRLLVTCRPEKTYLPGIRGFPLQGMARFDSLYLLSAIKDKKGIFLEGEAYERFEIEELLDLLQDYPLSIELVTPHLKEMTPKRIREEFSELLDSFTDDSAFEGRNKSLFASIEFSKRRLSKEARLMLPYLSWFRGGVFEQLLLDLSGIELEKWGKIRAELINTALISIEEGITINNRSYLRFHPTLPYAAQERDVPDLKKTEEKFIKIYIAVRKTIDDDLRGANPALGMAILLREEANIYSAISRAFRIGEGSKAWNMADTLLYYLERSARFRERDALIIWVKKHFESVEILNEASCASILQYSWSLLTQGKGEEAIDIVKNLIHRIEIEGLEGRKSPEFQIALCNLYLGRIYYSCGYPEISLGPLQKAISIFENLGKSERENLYVALSDLSSAYRYLGRFDKSLEIAERVLAINRELRRNREVASVLVQCARILMEQHRYTEAKERYEEALNIAKQSKDIELQGTILQSNGVLCYNIRKYDQAVKLYKEAIYLFRRHNDKGSEMRTCDLIASVERVRGHLDAAEAWYARSWELAIELNDLKQQAVTSQNLGILYQTFSEKASDDKTKKEFLLKAASSVEESLNIEMKMKNTIGIASSYSQLGVLHWMLGDLIKSEEYTRESLKIRASLNLPEVYKDYNILADIARDKGDTKAEAMWRAKYKAKLSELERLRKGKENS
ncbi:tetratricopeptide repeat protein [Candidatus Sumerlaeota bacterium]|nr:tetratricopeptide repeat protein [Candidatus Sumerlaeota bacterium]